jgi:hypothetical protein
LKKPLGRKSRALLGRITHETVSVCNLNRCNALVAASAAFAGEQVLEFKLVTRLVNPTVLEAAYIEGQTMTASKAVGVAYFKDGRVASKDFIITLDLRSGSGA